MERITTSDMNRRMSEVLGRVEAGQTFMLTRYGKDVAVLSPVLEYRTPASVRRSARDELLNRIRSR